ncbi:MAG: AraC family transcriptional regulator [Armatimonas sp.]
MTPSERLNLLSGRVRLADDTWVEVRNWASSAQLPDNVPHRHAYHEVCLVGERGQGVFHVEGTPYSLEPSTLFFARPGVLHQITNTEEPGMALRWVTFTLPPSPLAGTFAASATLISPGANALGALWEALFALADSGDTTGARELMPPLLRTLLRLGSDTRPAATADSGIAPAAVRAIHSRLDNPPTVAALATRFALSERHFARLFIAHTGIPPAAYIERARLERAAALLLRTDDPIKHVAALVGYPDVHGFTRSFTRVVGCPPAVFRKSRGAMANIPVAAPETEGKLVW